MKLFTISIFLLSFTTCLFAQAEIPAEYITKIKTADSFYRIKEYEKSANTYSDAFKSIGWKSHEEGRYNAVCSWALANEIDSVFANIDELIEMDYSDLAHIKEDVDLIVLHSDLRWNSAIKSIEENKQKIEINYNQELISLLDSLYLEDQKWRSMVRKFNNKELNDSTITMEFISKNFSKTDSLNTFQVRKIFQKYGFPNFDLVGETGSNKFWYLIQHQDNFPSLQDSILTLMKIEVDKGKASPTDYAYLIDRVKVNTGQLQIYGTQMLLNSTSTSYEPKPIIEIEKLDERRKSVGLPPEEEYIKVMNERYFGGLNHK